MIVIDDLEPEKVAERTGWWPGERVDIIAMRSRAYEQALGVIQERIVFFVKGMGWLIHDRVTAPGDVDLAKHRVDWLLHTPYRLTRKRPGLLAGEQDGGGLVVLAGRADELELPILEAQPAAVPRPADAARRPWDASQSALPDITSLCWRKKPVPCSTYEFVTLLLPYRGSQPAVELVATQAGWELRLDSQPNWTFQTSGLPTAIPAGRRT